MQEEVGSEAWCGDGERERDMTESSKVVRRTCGSSGDVKADVASLKRAGMASRQR